MGLRARRSDATATRRGIDQVCVHSLLRRHLVPPAVLNEATSRTRCRSHGCLGKGERESLIEMASNLEAMASNLLAMASTLVAMASNPIES